MKMCLSRLMSKVRHIPAMEFYSAMKRNKLLLYPITWMKLKCILIKWKKQDPLKLHIVWFHLYDSGKDETIRIENGTVIAKGWGYRGLIIKEQNDGNFRVIELFWMEPWWWTHDSMHLSKPMELCAPPSECYCI